jgi:hypothetical protein
MEPVNILLSREELLFVLNELQADFLPGLDPDPLDDLPAEQRAVTLTVAERALQARELVRRYASGELVLHNALLTAVGVCAYAFNAILVYHWPAQSNTPIRYFGHTRGDDVAAHSRPDESLHLFSLLPSKEQLLDQILAVCEYEEIPPAEPFEFTMSGDVLGQARALAADGDASQATELLVKAGINPAAANALAKTLAHTPKATILQTISQPGDGTVQKRDFTLLQNSGPAWLAVASPGNEAAELRVKTTNKDELVKLLSEWTF